VGPSAWAPTCPHARASRNLGSSIIDPEVIQVNIARLIPIVLLVSTAPVTAQERQLTSDDYAHAEQFLGAATASLVRGIGGPPTWLRYELLAEMVELFAA
jgi:hypothetical protein